MIPLVMLFLSSGFLFGWAKPTPVNTRNFKRVVRDDILTTLAGSGQQYCGCCGLADCPGSPTSAKVTPTGEIAIKELVVLGMPAPDLMAASPIVSPLVILFYLSILLNLF